jgi:hypothetical protein
MKHALNNLLLRIDNILSAEYTNVYLLPPDILRLVHAMYGAINKMTRNALEGYAVTDGTLGTIATNKQLIHTIITEGDLSGSHPNLSRSVSELKEDLKTYIDAELPKLLDSSDGNRNSIIVQELELNLCYRLYLEADGDVEDFHPFVHSLFSTYQMQRQRKPSLNHPSALAFLTADFAQRKTHSRSHISCAAQICI